MCAQIKPFRAVRPSRDLAHLVATRSFISYKKKNLERKLDANTYSFIHIINPEHGSKDRKTRVNSSKHFKNIRAKYLEFSEKKYLNKDRTPSIYIYRQTHDGHSYLGFIAITSVNDYKNKVIKIHEQTIPRKLKIFGNYLDHTGINAEPVLLSYEDTPAVNTVFDQYTDHRPEYEFYTVDQVKHEMWLIENRQHIGSITKALAKIDSVYIADGHHRSASSAYLNDKRKRKKDYKEGDASEYYMAYFIQESNLKVFEFNRVIKDLNGLSTNEYLKKISEQFDLEEIEADIYKPEKYNEISMYISKKWYKLTPHKDSFDPEHPVNHLDCAIHSDNILAPIHSITDMKSDARIDVVGGLEGPGKLKELVDKRKYRVAFGFYPVSIEQIKQVADTNNIMPPKSTWVEPKLRSGLTIYEA